MRNMRMDSCYLSEKKTSHGDDGKLLKKNWNYYSEMNEEKKDEKLISAIRTSSDYTLLGPQVEVETDETELFVGVEQSGARQGKMTIPNSDHVDNDVGVKDNDVDNDAGVENDLVENDLMENDVGVEDEETELVLGALEKPSLLISF
ncbi:hypothetical protein LOK49_LG13G00748 [Camellia lanceoleosa]|uniref:Uncharacterized protein n=1 Tax=Camellia lanceoleosa TaxID=1840588 RepID=A0ACC0FKH1_9ERIC|nr:hypothetical protein LOK49_LG13G00748 [Camellia lanceoleosa]